MSNQIKKNVAKRQDALEILEVCNAIMEMPDWAWPTEGPKLREKVLGILRPSDGVERKGRLITTLKG